MMLRTISLARSTDAMQTKEYRDTAPPLHPPKQTTNNVLFFFCSFLSSDQQAREYRERHRTTIAPTTTNTTYDSLLLSFSFCSQILTSPQLWTVSGVPGHLILASRVLTIRTAVEILMMIPAKDLMC
jgi:hypothetical protein